MLDKVASEPDNYDWHQGRVSLSAEKAIDAEIITWNGPDSTKLALPWTLGRGAVSRWPTCAFSRRRGDVSKGQPWRFNCQPSCLRGIEELLHLRAVNGNSFQDGVDNESFEGAACEPRDERGDRNRARSRARPPGLLLGCRFRRRWCLTVTPNILVIVLTVSTPLPLAGALGSRLLWRHGAV